MSTRKKILIGMVIFLTTLCSGEAVHQWGIDGPTVKVDLSRISRINHEFLKEYCKRLNKKLSLMNSGKLKAEFDINEVFKGAHYTLRKYTGPVKKHEHILDQDTSKYPKFKQSFGIINPNDPECIEYVKQHKDLECFFIIGCSSMTEIEELNRKIAPLKVNLVPIKNDEWLTRMCTVNSYPSRVEQEKTTLTIYEGME